MKNWKRKTQVILGLLLIVCMVLTPACQQSLSPEIFSADHQTGIEGSDKIANIEDAFQIHINDAASGDGTAITESKNDKPTKIDLDILTGVAMVSSGINSSVAFEMDASDTIAASGDGYGAVQLNADSVTLYTVSVIDSRATLSGAGTYARGTTVTIHADTRDGYTFSGWTVVSGGVTMSDLSSSTTTFIMPANDVTVKANWAAIPVPQFTVTVIDSDANPTGEGSYTFDSIVTIHAGAREGYAFNGWAVTSGNAILVDSHSETTTFSMPSNDVVVTANWTQNANAAGYLTPFNLILGVGGVLAVVLLLGGSVLAFKHVKKNS
ncbi:MAG: InlB B-repeat-containing protein [Dehalococcoidia bacterium]|nr:InlB B-repeat-containing protein [Dehalococcoidia bacterium]